MLGGLFRFCLIIINGIIGFLGLVLVIAGAVFTWSKSLVHNLLSSVIVQLADKLNLNADEIGTKLTSIFTGILSLEDWFTKATTEYSLIFWLFKHTLICYWGIFALVFGLFIVSICALGLIGAICNIKLCILIYLLIVIAFTVVHAALILMYSIKIDKANNYVSLVFKKLFTEYKSLNSKEPASLFAGVTMAYLQCCGYENGEEFKSSKMFEKSETYMGKTYSTGTIEYPLPCCKMDNNLLILHNSCPASFNSVNSNIKTGCKNPINRFQSYFLDKIIYSTIILLIFNIAIIVIGALSIGL